MKKLIPADTVDADGNVWETVGENIRNGKKAYSEDAVKAIVDILFPVGSVYVGESSFILSVGNWQQIRTNARKPLILAGGNISGDTVLNQEYNFTEHQSPYTVVRMYQRIS